MRHHGPGDAEYEIWQMPAPATPQVTAAARLAGLRGRNLDLVERRVLKRLAQGGVRRAAGTDNRKCSCGLTRGLALTPGLLFRTLALMRNRGSMHAVAEGIEATGQEEAAYWLGMAMHRKPPRRVWPHCGCLLTEPIE